MPPKLYTNVLQIAANRFKMIFWTEKMIIHAKKLLLSYINYVKKFEGHKPGREKRLEHDPTIFRDRISFLITVDKF